MTTVAFAFSANIIVQNWMVGQLEERTQVALQGEPVYSDS